MSHAMARKPGEISGGTAGAQGISLATHLTRHVQLAADRVKACMLLPCQLSSRLFPPWDMPPGCVCAILGLVPLASVISLPLPTCVRRPSFRFACCYRA